MAWHLRKKRTGIRKISKVPSIKPIKPVKPIQPIRPVKLLLRSATNTIGGQTGRSRQLNRRSELLPPTECTP